MLIPGLAEENASVDSVVGFGDVEEYNSCFLTLVPGGSQEMASHSSSVESGEPSAKLNWLARRWISLLKSQETTG